MSTMATRVPSRIAKVLLVIQDGNGRTQPPPDSFLERIFLREVTHPVESETGFASHSPPERLRSRMFPGLSLNLHFRTGRSKVHNTRMDSRVRREGQSR